MPIYEYACQSCGLQTEIMHRISDPPVTECPACHAQTLVKQVSAAGFRLKGGGWYETDFKAGGKRNLAGEGADAGGSSSAAAAADSGGAGSHSCATGGCGCAPKTTSQPSSPSPSSPSSPSASPSAT